MPLTVLRIRQALRPSPFSPFKDICGARFCPPGGAFTIQASNCINFEIAFSFFIFFDTFA